MSDAVRSTVSTVLSWGMAFLLLCVSVYDVKRSSPAQFYPWIKLTPDKLTDVRAYNCENCAMWLSCAFVFVLIGIVGFFSGSIQAALFLLCLFPGTLFLCKRYKKILRIYLKTQDTQPN